MKKIGLVAMFTLVVGLFSANAQDQNGKDMGNEKIIDNTNLPDSALDQDNSLTDTTSIINDGTIDKGSAVPMDKGKHENKKLNSDKKREE